MTGFSEHKPGFNFDNVKRYSFTNLFKFKLLIGFEEIII